MGGWQQFVLPHSRGKAVKNTRTRRADPGTDPVASKQPPGRCHWHPVPPRGGPPSPGGVSELWGGSQSPRGGLGAPVPVAVQRPPRPPAAAAATGFQSAICLGRANPKLVLRRSQWQPKPRRAGQWESHLQPAGQWEPCILMALIFIREMLALPKPKLSVRCWCHLGGVSHGRPTRPCPWPSSHPGPWPPPGQPARLPGAR